MARDPEAIEAALRPLLEPDARGRLLARGLARGMIWREGRVPRDGPSFSEGLTDDLLHFGYGVLALALELRDANLEQTGPGRHFETNDAFRVAAESIESAMRRGDPTDAFRGLHLVVAAAAFHLAGFAARSFALIPSPEPSLNLSSAEIALALLLRRELGELRSHIVGWLRETDHTDEGIARRLRDNEDEFDLDDALVVALSSGFHQALGLADSALYYGDGETYQAALRLLGATVNQAAQVGNIPLWWVATLSRHLLRDLWAQSLHQQLPIGPGPATPERWASLRRDLIQSLTVRTPPQIDLWPSQLEAASRAIDAHDDLVVSLPTSSGKTRIAELCVLRSLADEKRVIYVTPLRALSAQIEKALSRTFVPLGASVTSLYGASGLTLSDAETLTSAEIVVATPEKLDFAIRQDPSVLDDVALVVFDEGHMIGLGSREIRYEVLIQRLLRREDAGRRRIVCLSAMFNVKDDAFQDFTRWLRSDEPGNPIHVNWRPTRQRLAFLDWTGSAGRLQFIGDEEPFVPRFIESRPPKKGRRKAFPQNEKEFCIAAASAFAKDGHSVLVYSPERRLVEPLVRGFTTIARQGYLDGIVVPNSDQLAIALAIGREWLGEDHPAVSGLTVGVGTHHGALPRPFLGAVEDLLNRRRLPVVVASPTLAQGIDLACSTLVFRSITRFNAQQGKQVPIEPAEFSNVVGRAGRAYVDIDGVAIYPVYDNHSGRHNQFRELASQAGKQKLWSGLARLVYQIAEILSEQLKVGGAALFEYVLNQPDLWQDERLDSSQEDANDEEAVERELADYLADLDVALLSLIEPLDARVDELASLLDSILVASLWKRTVTRESPEVQNLERVLLVSRAEWLWRTTSIEQRRACFSSSLGKTSGVFLYNNLDQLVDVLVKFQEAMAARDGDKLRATAINFAASVMQDRFFSVRKLPENWEQALAGWITGVPLAEVLQGWREGERPKIQAFIQDAVVFKLVWAAEAVRVQAQSLDHPRSLELGEGPALVLTYGVPSIAAALLCQRGLASRAGAIWATSQLRSRFSDFSGLLDWMLENHSQLLTREFWPSDDQYLLWKAQAMGNGEWRTDSWSRRTVRVAPDWWAKPPRPASRVRIVPQLSGTAIVSSESLEPLGSVKLDFDVRGSFLTARALVNGELEIEVFGPA